MISPSKTGLHHLGATRSHRAHDHLLQTPDTFVWAPLPGLERAVACVHASPRLGAGFTQYSIEFEAGGSWQSSEPTSRFVYVLSGSLHDPDTGAAAIGRDDFFYAPPFYYVHLVASEAARVIIVEKPYVPLSGFDEPAWVTGNAADTTATPLLGDEAVQVRSLLHGDASYDMAVNTMTYQPGARLGMVEVHVMEHGLLMLEGEGIYRLGDAWYPVTAGDFIWMAPYCPQWFGALGSSPSKYLIYKDWNRSPLTATVSL